MSLILMKPLNRELFTHGRVWNYGKASDVGCNKIWWPQKYIIKFPHVSRRQITCCRWMKYIMIKIEDKIDSTDKS